MNKNKKPRMTKKDMETAKRLLKYVTEKYKLQFILVFFCILISAVATTAVSLSFLCRCCCHIYLYKNDGLYRTGCAQKST